MLPKTLRELAVRYRNKKNTFDKEECNLDKPGENNSKFQSFLNSFMVDVLIFIATTYYSDYCTNCNVCIIQTI